MAGTVSSESRKADGFAGNGHAGQEKRKEASRRQEDALLVSQEILRLVEASKEGRLTERGRVSEFTGVYREMVRGHQRDAGRDSAAHRGRQPHSGADFRRQDRRADRADLQGRSREDEGRRQQRRLRAAEPAEGDGAADRRVEGRPALRARQAGAVPGRVCGNCARGECHAGRDSAAHRGRQPDSGADFRRQDR